MAGQRRGVRAKTLNSYLNRAAFAQPALGTFGNEQRNSIRGPNFWTTNLALSKLVPMGATQNVELRLEAFNALNMDPAVRRQVRLLK